MNPDKPSPLDSDERDHRYDTEQDAIPILDEALDYTNDFGGYTRSPLSNQKSEPADKDAEMDANDTEVDVELMIDLGYAGGSDDDVESDSLADMEEIHTLPLAEMVLDESPGDDDNDDAGSLASTEQQRQIATLEAIVFDGDDPNAPAPKYGKLTEAEAQPALTEQPAAHVQTPLPQTEPLVPPPVMPPLTKPLPKKSENPFLPQHILDRLNQGKRNLVEEIAQSSAALDASTAILRTHARAERLSRPAYGEAKSQPQYSFNRDKSSQQKQKIVDDLVEEYLPLIAAELRRRLRKILDE